MGNDSLRKKTDGFWIFNLQSLFPGGMNIDFFITL